MAFTHMNDQLEAFQSTLEQECSRQLQDMLQRQLEEKRTHIRQNLVRKNSAHARHTAALRKCKV